MARPSDKAVEYRERAERMSWDDLHALWSRIKEDDTPGWDAGKALEHLVVRAFQLSGLEVQYPYDVPPGGKPLEQIDGLVYLGEYAFLIECKARDAVDVEVIAKLRNQLLRRPETTFGCVFVAGNFTGPALVLADFAVPHRILLWSAQDIDTALGAADFQGRLREKYRHLCMYGLTDHSLNYQELGV